MRYKLKKGRKICSVEGCNRSLAPDNKSGLCHRHLVNKMNREKARLLKLNHKCFICGKPVEPTRCPHCGGILKYSLRCADCRKIANEKAKKKQREQAEYIKKMKELEREQKLKQQMEDLE